MCGGYLIYSKFRYLAKRFETKIPQDIYPDRYNARPSQLLPIITQDKPNDILLKEWGFSLS